MSAMFIVRQVEAEDLEAVVDLAFEYVDFYGSTPPPREQMKQIFAHLLESPERGLQFVAEGEGQLLGFATMYFTFSTLSAKPAAVMNDLFVKPEFRRQAVGEHLLEACKKYVKQHEYAYLEWVTASNNVNAQGFYDRMGATRSDWVVYMA